MLDSENVLDDMHISQENEQDAKKDEASDETKPRKPAFDLELLFDNYLMQIEWLGSEIQELLNEITNTEGECNCTAACLPHIGTSQPLSLTIAQRTLSCIWICFGTEF